MSGAKLKFPKKPYKTFGGVKVPHNKFTSEYESVIMPPPESVTIPMIQHIGAPCTPVVKPGDEVTVGQLIGDSDKYISAPIHSSVSGVVTKITKFKLPNGVTTEAVVIKSDGLMTPCPDIKPPVVEDMEDLVRVCRESGLVGLGGAGFPAHVKLNIPEGKSADTLIINCAECEPYITADYREAIENPDDILMGIYTITPILGIRRVIIGVEKNKPEAIKILKEISDSREHDPDDIVRILPLPSYYPQGAEKVLIQACTGRRVPAGGLPIDVGCIVMNIASVGFLARYMKTGMPLITKRLTVDGSAVEQRQNVIAPIGASVKDVIDFCGGYYEEPAKLLYGGPMMGIALSSDEEPVLKYNNAILAFNEKEAKMTEPTDCIRCGRCVSACPMHLTPPYIAGAVKQKDAEQLKKLGVMNCMECGCCAFNCPANRYIVQTMRLGKSIVRSNS